jgi:hypothetical protein
MAAEKCSQRLLDSHWALLKGYRKAVGKYPKAFGKSLGNSISVGKPLGNA